tara:strand:- start:876 stop:2390 length:1515 start_codon:yes stop_codon:yes gene_type:complete
MKYGSISTGSKEATLAAEEILQFGGNAFDAAISAIFVSMTSEFALTGIFGGGTLLGIKDNEAPFVYDFFVNCPESLNNPNAEFKEVMVNFGNTKQKFHIGKGSIATPGNLMGLLEIQKKYGMLNLKDVLSPAKEIANSGVEITKHQSDIIKLVDPILTFDNSGKELFLKNGNLISEGDIFKNIAFADFLDILGKNGSDYFYKGEGLNIILNHCSNGGHIKKNDFNTYKVYKRESISLNYLDHDIFTNPAPSFGGSLIVFLLKLFKNSKNKLDLFNLIKGMNLSSLARNEICKNPDDEMEINKIFKDNCFSKYLKLFQDDNVSFAKSLDGFGSTTHVSVLDKNGNAASVTTTNGEGCGYIIPEFGIMMNNMLGEQDLNPFGFHNWNKARRLPTMISPIIICKNNKPKYILGSGGSNRIRSANIQVMFNLLHKNYSLEKAIDESRIHLEGNTLFFEPGVNLPIESSLKGLLLNSFSDKNVFFGGVNAVSMNEAVGDKRRGGYGIVN